ncbi:MAG: hypothetical protein WDM86_15405 [Rhizomicrobium sp.]
MEASSFGPNAAPNDTVSHHFISNNLCPTQGKALVVNIGSNSVGVSNHPDPCESICLCSSHGLGNDGPRRISEIRLVEVEEDDERLHWRWWRKWWYRLWSFFWLECTHFYFISLSIGAALLVSTIPVGASLGLNMSARSTVHHHVVGSEAVHLQVVVA